MAFYLLLSDTTLRFANHAKQRITQKACKSKHKSKAMYILLDKRDERRW